jgi:hypothetical protein
MHGPSSIVTGTDKGDIKIFSNPLAVDPEELYEMESFNAHFGTVVKIRTSCDGRYVFSAGEDGSIFIYCVTIPGN